MKPSHSISRSRFQAGDMQQAENGHAIGFRVNNHQALFADCQVFGVTHFMGLPPGKPDRERLEGATLVELIDGIAVNHGWPSLLGVSRPDRFQGSDMEQATPDRPVGEFLRGTVRRGVGNGNIQPVSQEQGHFGMADFVNIAARESNPKRLEGATVQKFLGGGGTHTSIIASKCKAKQSGAIQPPLRLAGASILASVKCNSETIDTLSATGSVMTIRVGSRMANSGCLMMCRCPADVMSSNGSKGAWFNNPRSASVFMAQPRKRKNGNATPISSLFHLKGRSNENTGDDDTTPGIR